MRIVSGIYRGRRLAEFKGDAIRPTADNVREALFNILQTRIYGSTFLDLYAGTGAVGIEALSRGAESVTFNDQAKESIALLKANLTALKITQRVSVNNLSAQTFLKNNCAKFDIIFLDPPYLDGISEEVRVNLQNALSPNGVVVFEGEAPFEGEILGLKQYDQRKYGRVYLSFFRCEE